MSISQAIGIFLNYHKGNSKSNTIRNYEFLLSRFSSRFGDRELGSITTEEILTFLTQLTEGAKQSTKRLRYALLSAFFSFIRNSIDPTIQNPCDASIL